MTESEKISGEKECQENLFGGRRRTCLEVGGKPGQENNIDYRALPLYIYFPSTPFLPHIPVEMLFYTCVEPAGFISTGFCD